MFLRLAAVPAAAGKMSGNYGMMGMTGHIQGGEMMMTRGQREASGFPRLRVGLF
jgi:hypothetical protein